MVGGPNERAQQLREKLLRKELYVITTTNVAPKEKLDEILHEHLEHQIRLEKEGIMFGAGPLFREDGSRKCGMIVVRAASFEEAHAIADRDPYHSSGMRTYTVDRWTMNEGSYTVTVNYSDQTVRIA